MAGASDQTQRIAHLNANWSPADGFELQVVTEDGERHNLPASADEITALVAMSQADTVMLFDPADRTVIVANIVGEWIQRSWSAGDDRRPR